LQLNLETNEIESIIKFENNAIVIVNGGNNIGRVGVLQHVEHHPGSYEIAHVKDATGAHFSTRMSNIFAIGDSKKPMISLPKGKGIKMSLIEERRKRIEKTEATTA
jgi:small subunit ribosomal protein S4e